MQPLNRTTSVQDCDVNDNVNPRPGKISFASLPDGAAPPIMHSLVAVSRPINNGQLDHVCHNNNR